LIYRQDFHWKLGKIVAIKRKQTWQFLLKRLKPPLATLIYFLHIPKTSGTSLGELFLQVKGPEAVSPPLLWDHLLNGFYRISEKTRIIQGHFGGLLPLWLQRWPRIVTILREPLARALSHINHVQRDPNHPWYAEAANLTVQQYCDHPVFQRSIDNFQARYLASLSFALALLPDSPQRPPAEPLGNVEIAFDDALFSLDREPAF